MKSHNLNLLRTLQVLLEECHVSRTAERLHITQSAVSRQLTQLREVFNDTLLIREGNRLLLTPRAEALKLKLGSLLAECNSLFEPVTFQPEQWQGKVVLSSSDYVAQYILPEVVEHLREHAPLVSVAYQLWSPKQFEQLADLDIQFVSTMLPAIPDGLCGEPIGADYPVCVMRSDHPLATADTLQLNDFLYYDHASVTGGGDKDSFVDLRLAEQGLSRRVKLSVPFFTSALNTICRSDMLLVIPEHIAVNMKQLFPITYFPLPISVPEHKYWLLWHPKYNNEPSHQWMRTLLLTTMRSSMYSMPMINNHEADELF